MYDPSALALAPGRTTAPLLVNHDDSQVIGTVDTLMRVQDTDGPWLCGLAEVHDCPGWLRRNTPVSFAYHSLGTSRDVLGGCEIVRRGLVTEVSVLPPWSEPAEPLAKVLTLHPTETKPAAVAAHRATPGEEITHTPPVPVRRARTETDAELDEFGRLDWHEAHGTGASLETVLLNMQRELAPTALRRYK
jgi:hypothetical protein